jgi:hypothetical protein
VIDDLRLLVGVAARWPVVRTSLRVTMLVGTILNLANHWQALVAGSQLPWFHLAINYVIPYCVSSYSAARNELTRADRDARRRKQNGGFAG